MSCGTDVEGYVTNGGDCDDSNDKIYSGAFDIGGDGMIKIVMVKILLLVIVTVMDLHLRKVIVTKTIIWFIQEAFEGFDGY